MSLEKVIAISGKPGLYKLLAQSKNSFIVEALEDGRRFPVASNNNVSLLVNVAVYTDEGEKPLMEVYDAIAKKEKAGTTLNHKEDMKKLRDYFASVLPNYAAEKVYDSDLRKLFQWYNLLHKQNYIPMILEAFDQMRMQEAQQKSTQEIVLEEAKKKKTTTKKTTKEEVVETQVAVEEKPKATRTRKKKEE